MQLFENATLGGLVLPNRIIRSATFEARADSDGLPLPAYGQFYTALAEQGVGAMITGFAYVTAQGKAMQPRQAGMDTQGKVAAFRQITRQVHALGSRMFLQIAHTGRQTIQSATGMPVVGVSSRASAYFGGHPQSLTTGQTHALVEDFVQTARWAQQAEFDGVQIHAAHGYLIHQFLNRTLNRRHDVFGQPTHFLALILRGIKKACGSDFPVLIKVSGHTRPDFAELIRFLDAEKVTAIEISYGTMDQPFNIIRGGTPLDLILRANPVYRSRSPLDRTLKRWLWLPFLKLQVKPFTPVYNLPAAQIARRLTKLPILCVGGIRTGKQMRHVVEDQGMDFASVSRPLLCEPDFVRKLSCDPEYESKCQNCNWCTVLCDSGQPTRCYRKEPFHGFGD